MDRMCWGTSVLGPARAHLSSLCLIPIPIRRSVCEGSHHTHSCHFFSEVIELSLFTTQGSSHSALPCAPKDISAHAEQIQAPTLRESLFLMSSPLPERIESSGHKTLFVILRPYLCSSHPLHGCVLCELEMESEEFRVYLRSQYTEAVFGMSEMLSIGYSQLSFTGQSI